MREILGVFEVFLGVFKKTKDKKERVRLWYTFGPVWVPPN